MNGQPDELILNKSVFRQTLQDCLRNVRWFVGTTTIIVLVAHFVHWIAGALLGVLALMVALDALQCGLMSLLAASAFIRKSYGVVLGIEPRPRFTGDYYLWMANAVRLCQSAALIGVIYYAVDQHLPSELQF